MTTARSTHELAAEDFMRRKGYADLQPVRVLADRRRQHYWIFDYDLPEGGGLELHVKWTAEQGWDCQIHDFWSA